MPNKLSLPKVAEISEDRGKGFESHVITQDHTCHDTPRRYYPLLVYKVGAGAVFILCVERHRWHCVGLQSGRLRGAEDPR